jgi:FtsX-like permease family
MTLVSAVGLLLRRVRPQLAAVALVAGLVAWTSFVVTAGPRLFEQTADDALRHAVAGAPVTQRAIELTTTVSAFGSGSESGAGSQPGRPVPDVEQDGDLMVSLFPAAVRSVLGSRDLAITAPRMNVTNPPSYPMFVTLRYQESFPDLVDLVAGRWPQGTGASLPPSFELDPTDHTGEAPRVFQIAILDSSARALGLAPGDRLSVGVDTSAAVFRRQPFSNFLADLPPTELEITGLYRVRDQDADAWFGESSLRVDDLGETMDQPVASLTAFAPADAIPGLETSGLPFTHAWRYPVLPDRLDQGGLDELVQGLRLLDARFTATLGGEGVTLQTALLPLVDGYRAQRAASEAILTVAAMGPLALAAGAVVLAAVLLAARRRAALVLARSRGASARLLLLAELWEAVLMAGAASLLGLAAAVLIVPAPPIVPSLLAAVAAGAAAIVALVGATWSTARRSLDQAERVDVAARRLSPRRLVGELTLVAIAVVGALLLRQRGLGVGGDGLPTRFDPFLAAVPPLIGLAVGIVTIRLYPVPVWALGRLAARRRDLVPVLGLRTVARYAATSLPLVVLVLAAAFGAFASVISTSLDRAQVGASWDEVGADYQIETVGAQQELPAGVDPASVPGVEAVAPAVRGLHVSLRVGASQQVLGDVTAIDPDAYARVTAGSPLEPGWPPALLAADAGGPVPAIMSTRLAATASVAVGSSFKVTNGGRTITLRLVDTRAALPGLTAGTGFIVVPLASLQAALGGPALRPNVIWVRAPAEAGQPLAAALEKAAATVGIESRYATYDSLHDQPLVAAVTIGFLLALLVSAAYTGLTIVGALVLSGARRSRDLALLGTLGVDRRQAAGLTVVEHGPPILLSLLPGLALGIAVADLLLPSLGLGAFVSSNEPVGLIVDWPALAAVAGGLAALAVAAIVAGTWLSRRTVVMNALRMGDD